MQAINKNDIFQSTANWKFTQHDELTSGVLSSLITDARKSMPSSIYSSYVMTHYQQMLGSPLYKVLKSVPKGVLHHNHIDCNEDKQYYRQFIINDRIIYLNQQKNEFRVGTTQEATQGKWISMKQIRQSFTTQQQMVNFISNVTMFNHQDNRKIAAKQIPFWGIFQKKIVTFFTILYEVNHFKSYMKYVCQKYIKNGYDRLQFRSMLTSLKQYDLDGNLVKTHPQSKFVQVLDQVEAEIKQHHPNFSLGLIFFGLKMLSPEINTQIFTNVCELNWNKTIGFDLVQQQDPYGSLKPYDQLVDKVLAKYPHLNIKKVYHAGQTKNPTNDNIEIAVKGGSVRLGHGINIIQRLQFLPSCKHICFQISPVSNILTSLRDDSRIASAPILMNLGYALTINPDDPGKFGYEDSTVDYFSSMISFNWGLKELKLIAIHSINHAICSQQEKVKLFESFYKRWDQWVKQLKQ